MSGLATRASPAAELPPTSGTNESEEQTEEEEVDGEGIKAPLELLIEVKRLISVICSSITQIPADRSTECFIQALKKNLHCFVNSFGCN